MRADVDTGIALDALVLIPDDFAVDDRECFWFSWASGDTLSAVDTHMDRLRIVAEITTERTLLNEDRGPVTWTIDVGESDDSIYRRSRIHGQFFYLRHLRSLWHLGRRECSY